MTRINLVNPKELSRLHLVAEYRELPRVLTLARKAYDRGEKPDDPCNPTEYVLGTGHVRFFYNKQKFLRRRHFDLVQEMIMRGYQANHEMSEINMMLPSEWQNDYEPTREALTLNRQRIKERS